MNYGSEKKAGIVYSALTVDKEVRLSYRLTGISAFCVNFADLFLLLKLQLQPDKVKREVSVSDGKLIVWALFCLQLFFPKIAFFIYWSGSLILKAFLMQAFWGNWGKVSASIIQCFCWCAYSCYKDNWRIWSGYRLVTFISLSLFRIDCTFNSISAVTGEVGYYPGDLVLVTRFWRGVSLT